MSKPEIKFDSQEAAEYRTNIEGWVSANGRFWGKDERAARYDGCTHRKCEKEGCENYTDKNRLYCQTHAFEKSKEVYLSKPYKEWDKEIPLVIYNDDRYFFSVEDLEEYLEENDSQDIRLMVCQPNYLTHLDTEQWREDLPEDWDLRDVDEKLENMVKEINKYIDTLPPASWSAGSFRTSYAYNGKETLK